AALPAAALPAAALPAAALPAATETAAEPVATETTTDPAAAVIAETADAELSTDARHVAGPSADAPTPTTTTTVADPTADTPIIDCSASVLNITLETEIGAAGVAPSSTTPPIRIKPILLAAQTQPQSPEAAALLRPNPSTYVAAPVHTQTPAVRKTRKNSDYCTLA
ncbi:MAG: hypothetical protein EBU46_16785, partial [Nitrosomonadaceae bacterium]|nr:hypothetical protein [Nitrosomonadaceae bacterium]